MPLAKSPVRLHKHFRNRLLLQALEPRVLLTTTFVHDSGNITTNGTNFQNAINAAALGDTIVLDANIVYLASVNGFTLPSKTGTGTITIESATIYNGTGLNAGVRVGPSDASLMPQIQTPGSNAPVFLTATGGATVHDYALLGLELAPHTDTSAVLTLLRLGSNTSLQSTVASIPYNFVVDRCYIHGLDNLNTDYQLGIDLETFNTTIENSYISDIHAASFESKAIAGERHRQLHHHQ